MTKEESILKDQIMMRVRFVYGVKSLPRVFIPKLAVLASLVAIAGFFVSVPNVIHNMPSLFEIGDFVRFLTAAFINTKFYIQAVSLGTIIIAGLMLRDIMKVFRAFSLRAVAF
ncbi:MAG: hypothetical protein UX89_C0007G0038 [Parcubacteria group bacterium GW2011_GWA2_47_16]|nr:MAG: hypothetical protein UX89_C0007G0038 [Parcubacteria group bacterium GW2011_GWA2_47_16]